MMTAQEARDILETAEVVWPAQAVAAAVRRVADEVTDRLANSHPLVLSVMGGAVVFTGNLLPLLRFPLDFDYVHVTRYGGSTSGSELRWIAAPQGSIAGRTVLVVDDILDEGITLNAIRERVLQEGATACYTAVLADKDLGTEKPIKPDFRGLSVPNRFVFGYGMDVRGAWRNLPAIYALKEQRPSGCLAA